jgi:hypothetical protein
VILFFKPKQLGALISSSGRRGGFVRHLVGCSE